jgi:hypothetical protein
VANTGEKRNPHRVLLEKHEGKKRLGKSRCRWMDNVITGIKETACNCAECIRLAWNMV